MEVGSDLMSSLRQRLGFVPAGTGEGQPEWAGLVARFSASHAARRVLEGHEAGYPGGDFTQWRASTAAGSVSEKPTVNPTDLKDGKAPGCKIGPHAGSAVAEG